MLLSLKVSYFVYENISFFESSESISVLIDLEENESKEIDEIEKIHQSFSTYIFNFLKNHKNHFSIQKNYMNWYLEYNPPPPEFS